MWCAYSSVLWIGFGSFCRHLINVRLNLFCATSQLKRLYHPEQGMAEERSYHLYTWMCCNAGTPYFVVCKTSMGTLHKLYAHPGFEDFCIFFISAFLWHMMSFKHTHICMHVCTHAHTHQCSVAHTNTHTLHAHTYTHTHTCSMAHTFSHAACPHIYTYTQCSMAQKLFIFISFTKQQPVCKSLHA